MEVAWHSVDGGKHYQIHQNGNYASQNSVKDLVFGLSL